MNPHKIVMEEMKRDSYPEIFVLLRKETYKSCKSTELHSICQVKATGRMRRNRSKIVCKQRTHNGYKNCALLIHSVSLAQSVFCLLCCVVTPAVSENRLAWYFSSKSVSVILQTPIFVRGLSLTAEHRSMQAIHTI